MPKQKIYHSTPLALGESRFDLLVGWQRDCDVQVGIETPDEGGAGTGQRHFIDYLYGDQQATIGRQVIEWAQGLGAEFVLPDDAAKDLAAENTGRWILDLMTASTMHGTSVWWSPTRAMINDFIRVLRKARDQAFGSDA